jgi:hypothetical protein
VPPSIVTIIISDVLPVAESVGAAAPFGQYTILGPVVGQVMDEPAFVCISSVILYTEPVAGTLMAENV